MTAFRPDRFVLGLLALFAVGPACNYDYGQFNTDDGAGSKSTVKAEGGAGGTAKAKSGGSSNSDSTAEGGRTGTGGTTAESSASGGTDAAGGTTADASTLAAGGTTADASTLAAGGTTNVTAPTTCPNKQTLCSAGCTDLRYDSSNCGACGVICPGTLICNRNVCQ